MNKENNAPNITVSYISTLARVNGIEVPNPKKNGKKDKNLWFLKVDRINHNAAK